MKRYSWRPDLLDKYHHYKAFEDPNGEWVSFDDAKVLLEALEFYAGPAWEDTGCNGRGYQRWLSDTGEKARKALAKVNKGEAK